MKDRYFNSTNQTTVFVTSSYRIYIAINGNLDWYHMCGARFGSIAPIMEVLINLIIHVQ